MAARKSRRKLKIAVIFMPCSEIRPPVSLTGLAAGGDLVTDEIARRLARSHDVIAYCSRGEHQEKVEQLDAVEYRRMSTSLDRWYWSHHPRITPLIDLVCRRNAAQPIFNSSLWFRQFIGEALADPQFQDCDIVHIVNMSQFVPFVRRRAPRS